MTWLKRIGILLGIIVALLAWPAYQLYAELEKARSDDPLVWESAIADLENAGYGPAGSVLVVGSSSIRLWDTLASDMAPLTTIQRGFGGAKVGDAIHYVDRLMAVPEPAAIVLFVGTNDITPERARSLDYMLESFTTLVTRIRAMHPDVPIYNIAITPSPLRWAVWPEAQAVNAAIENAAEGMSRVYIIDTGSALMSNGVPDPDNYIFDGLHLSERGYAIWTEVIRGRLLQDLQ